MGVHTASATAMTSKRRAAKKQPYLSSFFDIYTDRFLECLYFVLLSFVSVCGLWPLSIVHGRTLLC